ncbi:bicyclomycin resistance protein [Streptomyces sulfonofaciens]|uniref:Bicyclomycin resistance protein n=1 Tax=Streptomyces sulfonofaciens TaxID=68272 RepID=A0A919GN57_9ACTN|nr:extracellular solute-binding protein [Streptomyces sulfonofaciens]GHH86760.1 bicyclomycin resistance protein [Streptomyces sulfonofaciens]
MHWWIRRSTTAPAAGQARRGRASRLPGRARPLLATGLAAALGAGLLAGCATHTGPAAPDNTITVWSEENLPPRMAVTNKIIHRFEHDTGIKVKLVGVDEAQLPQLIMSAAASGTLPDVLGAVPMGQIWQMYSNGLLNTKVSGDIVRGLGRGTFDANALRLTSDSGTQLSVPSDAWLQLLVYRKDRLAKAHLPVPDTYASLVKDAAALTKGGKYGTSVATDASDPFTQQSFEDLALAGGCQLVNGGGAVTLDSPACRTAFSTYDKLAADYGAPGTQTVDSTRATYFAGQSSIVLWSSSLLDELAGLRSDALPSCPECKKDKGFLASHSGLVTALSSPGHPRPAQFGEVTSWAVSKTAETAASEKFITYMMNKGYEDWFGMAPEGKIPVRKGTAAHPDQYQAAWRSAKIGVDTLKPLDQVYPKALLDQLVAGVGTMQRWGITQGQGALVGAINGELPVPKALTAMTSGQTSPRQAAQDAQDEVSALQKSLQ